MPKTNIIDTPEDIQCIKDAIQRRMNLSLEAIASCGNKVCAEEERNDGFHKARMSKLEEKLEALVVRYAKSWQELNVLCQRNRLTNDQRYSLRNLRRLEEHRAMRPASEAETNVGGV